MISCDWHMKEKKQNSIGTVKLHVPPWIAGMLNIPSSDWIILKKEIGKDTTIGNVLSELALSSNEFKKAVFNPDTGGNRGQVMVFLNNSIVRNSDIEETRLNSGDSVRLLPVYMGG